jgi:hypothetical protein
MSEGTPGPSSFSDVSTGPTPARRSFVERLVGALRLDPSVYEEVEHDQEALPQAAGVVALAAVCAGIGGAAGGGPGLVVGVIGAVVGWFVSAGIIWFIGVRLMEHSSDYPELLRTIGFASSPQVLLVLAAIPVLGWGVRSVVFVWGLAAYVVAVRQALDVDTGRAVLVCVLGWGLAVVVALLLASLAVSCAPSGGAMV